MKKNALSSLLNPTQSPEAAYRWLVKPENGSSLRQAIKLMGEPQTTALRQTALKELLTQTKISAASSIKAEALTEALSKYTPAQQKLLFPHGMADDLHLLGKEVEFLSKQLSDEAKASFAAGIVLHMPFFVRVPLQIGQGLYQTIISQPSVIRYLSIGLRSQNSRTRIATRELLKNTIRLGGVEAEQGESNEVTP
jgi:hypothetical protein